MAKHVSLLLPYATRPPYGPAALQQVRYLTSQLPPTLVMLWHQSQRGILIIDAGETPRCEIGPFYWRDIQAYSAVYLPPDEVGEAAWETIGDWLDHFGGSGGQEGCLSEGNGATPALVDAATRLSRIMALGYAEELLKTSEPSLLLARAIMMYHLSRQQLSATDPGLTRWLRGTLFNEGFWRRVGREWA